jgi:hypothetical protein
MEATVDRTNQFGNALERRFENGAPRKHRKSTLRGIANTMLDGTVAHERDYSDLVRSVNVRTASRGKSPIAKQIPRL